MLDAGGDATRAQSGPVDRADEQTAQRFRSKRRRSRSTDAPRFLLERLGEVFEAKKSMLQKARETVIAYQRLNSETQKKEILLSCIAEEMNSALANADHRFAPDRDGETFAARPAAARARDARDGRSAGADQQGAQRFRD